VEPARGRADLVQCSQDVAQVSQGLGGGAAQQGEALGDRFGQRRAPGGQDSGVQRDQAQPMGEHVVHLGGDTGALRGPRRLLAQFPLDSQVRDLAVQRLDQAATAGCSGKRSESRPSRTWPH
jgi:hypothetical protein